MSVPKKAKTIRTKNTQVKTAPALPTNRYLARISMSWVLPPSLSVMSTSIK